MSEFAAIVKETEEALTRLLGSKVTVNVTLSPDAAPCPTLRDRLLHCVADEFGITPKLMTGSARKKRFAEARMVYAYLAHKHFNDTQSDIGHWLNKDHTSVRAALEKINSMLQVDMPIRRIVSQIETQFLTYSKFKQ